MTETNPMEGLMEAWFDLSNEMGRAWAVAAGAGGKEVARAYRKWTESTAEMGRLVTSMMAGDPAAANSIARSWERWSEEVSRAIRDVPGADPAAMRDLQESWRKGYDRMSRLMTDSAMAQMRMVSRMGLSPEPEGPTASMPALADMPGMGMSRATSDYWMDHYQEAMDRATRALEGEGDAAGKGREVFNVWSDFYSGLLKQVMATPDYARTMGAARDAGMDAIKRSREASEAALKAMGAPTRSDMDEVHRALKDLSMDMKELRSDLRRSGRASIGGGGTARGKGKGKATTQGRGKGRAKGKGRGRDAEL